MHDLSVLIGRHCPQEISPTAIPRLILTRADAPTVLRCAVFHPLLCVIVRGRKRVQLGREVFEYDPSTYLLASAELPVTGQVIEAPYCGLTLALDPAALAALLYELPAAVIGRSSTKAMAVSAVGPDLLDPISRLLRLLDHPSQIPVMAPLIEREIYYRLLLGERGSMLRQLAVPASQLSQISRVIARIRSDFHETLRIEELAALAGMSAPSFHRHFRAVTNLSPLQFQKRLRLQEARTLLLSQHGTASSVAFAVGYESPSQFTRDYRRLFGAPPAREAAEARRTLALA